jgi:hypothetical protein
LGFSFLYFFLRTQASPTEKDRVARLISREKEEGMSSTQGKKRRREDGGGAKTHKGKDGKAGGGAAGTKPGLKHKKRKKERQVKKKGGELLIETKRLWEAIRRKDITKKERSAQVTALLKICRGQMLEVNSSLQIFYFLLQI